MQGRVNTYRKLLAQRDRKNTCIEYTATVVALSPELEEDIDGQTIKKKFYYIDDLESESERLEVVRAEVHEVLVAKLKAKLEPRLFREVEPISLRADIDYSLQIKKEVLGGK